MQRGLASLLVLMILSSGEARAGDAYFPLDKGRYWIFQGETKWIDTDDKSKTIHDQVLTRRMEVTDTLRKDNVFAAVIKGFPWDLNWHQSGAGRGNYLIIRVGTGEYFIYSGQDAAKKWSSLQARKPYDISNLVDGDALLLDAPLMDGKEYGSFESLTKDGWHWKVTEEDPPAFEPAKIKGKHLQERIQEFEMNWRSNPESMTFHFVPGIGFVHYEYRHHGTPSETDLDLIETGRTQ